MVIREIEDEGVGTNQREINTDKETRLSGQETAFDRTNKDNPAEGGSSKYGFDSNGQILIKSAGGNQLNI